MAEIICRRIDEQTPSKDGEVGERVLVGSGRKVCAGTAHRSALTMSGARMPPFPSTDVPLPVPGRPDTARPSPPRCRSTR